MSDEASVLVAGASFFYPVIARMNKLLILSVGYGQGHHAAAAALAEEFAVRGWRCRVADPCAEAHPMVFSCTQHFYDFCVRRAPWLWGVTYAQTDTADWRKAKRLPFLGDVEARVLQLLHEVQPDVVLCTYPLFAYMLDSLQQQGLFHGRYAVVVTDALVISRPWLQSAAPLVFVPDAYSQERVCGQFGLAQDKVVAGGFPVRRAFAPAADLAPPTKDNLRILVGAYRASREVACTVQAICRAYPAVKVTLLAAKRYDALRIRLASEIEAGQVELLMSTSDMARLMAQSHLYIGKAGAATLFECYASLLPLFVHFALPGQEQGNLELATTDGAALWTESAGSVLSSLRSLLADGAAQWHAMREAMQTANRRGGAARIADETERRFPL